MLFCVPACNTQEEPAPIEKEAVSTSDNLGTLHFTNVSEEIGLGAYRHRSGESSNKWFPETMSGGGAFVDFDGDGDEDILLVGGGSIPDHETGGDTVGSGTDDHGGDIIAFENVSGRFVERPSMEGLADLPGYGFGIYAADLDNDEDQDLFYTTLGRNVLLRNTGNGFERWDQGGLLKDERWSTAAAIFDANNDGWLDILVGNYVAWSPDLDIFCSADGSTKGYCTPELYEGQPGVFYLNQGEGVFIDATLESGFGAMAGKTLGIATADIDGKNGLDIIVANDTDPDQLFINQGNGTFVESGVSSGLAFDERGRARAGMGIDAAVVDTSGEITVFVGNFADEMIGVYRHIGNLAFLDRAATSRIGRASLLTLAFGLFVADLNLDGNADVFVANGHVEPRIERVRNNVGYQQRPHLFLGDGLGQFDDVAAGGDEIGFGAIVGRAASHADFDLDGDIDILVVENNGPANLYRNDVDGHSIRISLAGVQSNRDAVGTRVELWSNGRRQVQYVRSGSSYLSNSEKTITFGLGRVESADSIHVYWPSGGVDRIAETTEGRYRLVEGDHELISVNR